MIPLFFYVQCRYALYYRLLFRSDSIPARRKREKNVLIEIVFPFSYNNIVMENETFKELEEETLDMIRNSSYFRKARELSEKISSDATLIQLSKIRDDAYLVANTTDDMTLRHQKEIEAKKANDELLTSDIVREYMENYRIVKSLLNKINDEILKEFRYD